MKEPRQLTTNAGAPVVGVMRVDSNHGSILGYEPNSYGEWEQQPGFSEPPLSLEGAADHWNHRADDDYYSQPGALFRLASYIHVLLNADVLQIGTVDFFLKHSCRPVGTKKNENLFSGEIANWTI